jgi:hypothetical protein
MMSTEAKNSLKVRKVEELDMERIFSKDARKMTLGGRPPEQGGHKPIKLSLNNDIHKCLVKIKENGDNASKFVENYLESLARILTQGRPVRFSLRSRTL